MNEAISRLGMENKRRGQGISGGLPWPDASLLAISLSVCLSVSAILVLSSVFSSNRPTRPISEMTPKKDGGIGGKG